MLHHYLQKVGVLSLVLTVLCGTSLASAQALLTPAGSAALRSSRSYEVNDTKFNEAFITNPDHNAIDIYDTSNPAVPTYMSSIPVRGTNPSYEYIDGRYLYVAEQGQTNCFNNQCQLVGNYMQIFFITGKRASPLQSYSAYQSIAAQPGYVIVNKNTAYLLDWASSTVELVNVTNKVTPYLETTLSVNSPASIAIKDNYAYITSFQDGTLQIFNIQNVNMPQAARTVPLGSAGQVAINGHYAYVSNANSKVNIVDITRPLKAALASNITLPATSDPYNIFVDNSVLYVDTINAFDHLLNTYDLAASPTSPTLLQSFTTAYVGSSIDRVGNLLYITENNYTSTGQIELYAIAP